MVALSEDDVWDVLRHINDPEIPGLSIVDMKIVKVIDVDHDQVTIEVTPTFTGCPALDLISESIRTKLLAKGFKIVMVNKNLTSRWSTDLLDQSARNVLQKAGIAPPVPSVEAFVGLPTLCPYCKSTNTNLENPFGATLCKQLYYCNSCRQSFEKFKSL